MSSFLIPPNETPEEAKKRKQQAVAQALMQPPQDLGSGIAALGDAMLYRQQREGAAFPSAPGGGRGSFITAMKNMFSGRNNGGFTDGLYLRWQHGRDAFFDQAEAGHR